MTSDEYDAEKLASAVLKRYYKKDAYVNWTEIGEGAFRATEAGFFQFKYVLSLDGVIVQNVYRQFVHGYGVVADFEQSLSGEHFGFSVDYMRDYHRWNNPNYTPDMKVTLETHVSDEWSNDGDYSLKLIPTHIGWAGCWFKGNLFDKQPVPVAEGANGFKVVINASQPARGAKFSIMTDKGWLFSKEVDIVAGVHEYFVEADYKNENAIAGTPDVKVEFSAVRAFIVSIPYDPTKIFYFDSLAFVHVDEDAIVAVR